MAPRRLEPGTLWRRVARRSKQALERGALQPIATEAVDFVEDDICFSVRLVGGLQHKLDAGRTQRATRANPFLPVDAALFVSDVSETHICLLNKFTVLDHHLLIVTRSFEEQESLLTSNDFQALAACMAEFDGLGFYNSGPVAGASQRHKHLQLVPVPIGAGPDRVPVEARLRAGTLPFEHAASRVDGRDAEAIEHVYHQHIESLGLCDRRETPAPYNFFTTREWMVTIPRRQERVDGISLNALAFAGSLLVRNRSQLEALRQCGALDLLIRAAGRAEPGGDLSD